MKLFDLILLVASFSCVTSAFLTRCTGEDAAKPGAFSCLDNCDPNNAYGAGKICLSYLPNNARCFLDDFDRVKVLNCNGRFTANSPNRWMVYYGGSNSWGMMANFLDIVLDLPLGTAINRDVHWGRTGTGGSWQSLMDFVVDNRGTVVYRYSQEWGNGFSSRANLPATTFDILEKAPVPSATGCFRVTWAGTHVIGLFKDRFDNIVHPNSKWLQHNPSIELLFEWSGRHGDAATATKAVHVDHLNHIVSRSTQENFNIYSFVIIDSAFTCTASTNIEPNIYAAFQEVATTFPKYFWSKWDMAANHLQLHQICMQVGSHGVDAFERTAINRYFNTICPSLEGGFAALAPACLILDSEPACMTPFPHNTACTLHFKSVSVDPSGEFCPGHGMALEPLPLCKVPEPSERSRSAVIAFTVLGCLAGVAALIYVIYESWRDFKVTEETNVRNVSHQKLKAFFSFPPRGDNTSSRFEGINFARFIASVHIVCGHMFQDGHLKFGFFGINQFGYTWVPWFFMLSGFILTHSETKKKRGGDNTRKAPDETKTSRQFSEPPGPSPQRRFWDQGQTQQPNQRYEQKNPTGKHTPPKKKPLSGLFSFRKNQRKDHYQMQQSPQTTPRQRPPTTQSPPQRHQSPPSKPQSPPGKQEAKSSNSGKQLSTLEYIKRRLESLYPLYVIGIFVTIVTAWSVKGPEALPPPTETLLYFVLLQSWIPSVLEYGLWYLVQCWFMSCMLFYWVMFHLIHRKLDLASTTNGKRMLITAALCSVGIPFFYFFATIGDSEWYEGRRYLSVNDAVDVLVLTLKYHPIAYLHIFILGCTLPRVREVMLGSCAVKKVLPFLGLISYGMLLGLFLLGSEVPGYKLSLRLGLFSFFQSTLLIGLCNGQDLVGRLFNHPFLTKLGQYGYPQYIFQFIVYAWYSFICGTDVINFSYFLILFAVAVLSWNLVLKYCNGAKMVSFVKATIPFLLMYLLIQPFLTHPVSSFGGGIKAAGWWQDKPLLIEVKNGIVGPGIRDDYRIFNPSLYVDNNKRILLARRQYIASQTYSWYLDEDFGHQRFQTDIVLADYNKELDFQSAYIGKVPSFTPCIPPLLCNHNGSLTAQVVTSVQDPRIFKYRNAYYASMFSFNKATNPAANDYNTGSQMCVPDALGIIGRMYVTKLNDKVPMNPCAVGPIIPVNPTGPPFPPNTVLKNWLAFTFPWGAANEELYYIHEISPKFIVYKGAIGAAAVTVGISSTTESPKEILEQSIRAYAVGAAYYNATTGKEFGNPIHGSANPIYISKANSGLGYAYFLSAYHTVSAPGDSLHYATFAFTFCPKAPFTINALTLDSMPLRTTTSSIEIGRCSTNMAFLTSMTLDNCPETDPVKTCIVLSYGVCDRESRIVFVILEEFEKTLTVLSDCL